MQKSPFLRYTLSALSAFTLIPLTYTLINRQNAVEVTVDTDSIPAIHRHTTPHHNCSHCAKSAIPAARQAAQARNIAAAGLLWEKSSPDTATAAATMRITSGTPLPKHQQVGSRQSMTLEDGSELAFEVKSHHVHTDGPVVVAAFIPGSP